MRRRNLRGRSFGRKNGLAYLLLTPWLFGFLLMFVAPMIVSLYYSLTNFNMLNDPRFIGLDNYERMLSDDKFWQALGVTFSYVFLLVPLRLAFALAVAMLLNTKRKGLSIYRTFYYIPSIIGGSIAVSIVWRQIFGSKGVLQSLLGVIGIEQDLSLLGNPSTALLGIVLLGVWQFGSSMLIFLAALKQIPKNLYEAADIDGAGSWRKFFAVTVPMLSPTIFFNLVLQIINSFRVFTETKVITNGGPVDSTLTYVLYMYQRAFNFFDMGYSSALAWVLVAIIGVFTVILFRTQKSWVYYES
jgi:multiple sugar transport system permease protein